MCTAARLLDVRSAVRIVITGDSRCSSSGVQAPCGVLMGAYDFLISEVQNADAILGDAGDLALFFRGSNDPSKGK